jgi:hypothetical protein
MTFLNILIVVAVTLVVLIAMLWLLLRYALPWWLARKIAAMANLPQNPGIAARISLVQGVQDWQQPRTAALIEEVAAQGFEEVGRFSVPEMPTMQLWAGHHPQDGVAAAIYDHGQLPSFFDIVRVYDDYATCTVTTNPIHDPENVPPGSACVADPAMTPQTALQTLRAQPLVGNVMAVGAGNFSAVFVELYARSIDHILAKKMPDAEKMRQVGTRVSEATGQPVPQLDERQMGLAVEMERASRLSALEVAIVDRFLQSEQPDAREWERVRDRVMVVHDLLTREEAAELALTSADRDASQPILDRIMAEGLPPLDTFEKIAIALPESQRLRLLGEVDHPLYAQLYVEGY